MKSYLTLVLTFFFISLQTVLNARDQSISLLKEELNVELPGYTIEEIINVSEDEYYIGFKLNNANFQKEPVKLESGISNEFNTLFTKLPSKPDSRKITLRVNRIFVYEVLLSESRLLGAELNISFIEKHDSYFVELFRSTVSVNNRGSQKRQIIWALEKSIKVFSMRDSLQKLNQSKQPSEDLYTNPINTINQDAFMEINRAKRGIFWTYSDFYYNTPDTLTTFYSERNDRITRKDSLIIKHAIPYYNASLKSKYKIDAWGFADGERIFCKVGTHYFPLIKYERGYYLRFRAQNNSAAISAGVIGGLLGGLVGGLVAGTIVGITPGVNTIDQLLKLDINTGALDIFFKPDSKKISSKIIFYATHINVADGKLKLFIDEQFVSEIGLEQWVEIDFPAKIKTIDVELRSSIETVFRDNIEPSLFFTDVYLCYERKKKSPYFRKATYNSTQSILDKLKDENKITSTLSYY